MNKVTCAYEQDYNKPWWGKLVSVTDASGRVLTLRYNAAGKLKEVNDALATPRAWKILYEVMTPNAPPSQDGTGKLLEVRDPMNYAIAFQYYDDCDIHFVTDKNGNAHGLTYTSGRLDHVYDPAPFSSQVQTFAYGRLQGTNYQICNYTDRRGQTWRAKFDKVLTHLVEMKDPLGHKQTLAYPPPCVPGQPCPQALLIHEPTTYTNALSQSWDITYDALGNVLTVTDPMHHRSTYTYSPDGLSNLKTITPPGQTDYSSNTDKTVTLFYQDARNPTSVTRIEEPKADGASLLAVTLIEWFGIDNYNAFGMLKSVTPPSANTAAPVVTKYKRTRTFDPISFRVDTAEGPPDALENLSFSAVTNQSTSNAVGQETQSRNGITCPVTSYDANGNAVSHSCPTICMQFSSELSLPPNDGRPQACSAPEAFAYSDNILHAGCFTAQPFRATGEPTNLAWCVTEPDGDGFGKSCTRDESFTYDQLNRMRTRTLASVEATDSIPNPVIRTFSYDPDWTLGRTTTTGPDGQLTVVDTDNAGRPISYVRTQGPGGATLLSATVTYFDDNRIDTVTLGNGTRTKYEYDSARRMNKIRHEYLDGQSVWQNLHELVYNWTADGLVDNIVETDLQEGLSVVDFTYDFRNRLTRELRTGTHPYDMGYTYDLAGNRLTKVEKNAGGATLATTNYLYDVHDPCYYDPNEPCYYRTAHQGNRLMRSERYITATGVTHWTWYDYDIRGRATLVMRKASNDSTVHATRMMYDAKENLWLAMAESWQVTTGGTIVQGTCARESVMEYRYDSARARYMERPRDPATFEPLGGTAAGSWHDHDGDEIWSDYSVALNSGVPTITNSMTHAPGIGQYEPGAQGSGPSYQHANLIGTNEVMSNSAGNSTRRTIFTAFGEPVYENGSPDTRFGYAGEFGYQEAGAADPLAELGWLHVGHRYYDPSAGRFMQRDPIGIAGGMNTYAYCSNNPIVHIDPSGKVIIQVEPRLPRFPGMPFDPNADDSGWPGSTCVPPPPRIRPLDLLTPPPDIFIPRPPVPVPAIEQRTPIVPPDVVGPPMPPGDPGPNPGPPPQPKPPGREDNPWPP